jgi:hypothetical protein
MKRTIVAVAVLLTAALATMAQAPQQQKARPASPAIRCKNVDGRPCTSRQVQALSDAVFEGKSKHDVLLPVKILELASSDGTLKCEQSDGKVCTTPELDLIKEIAAAQQLFINYNRSNSKTGK